MNFSAKSELSPVEFATDCAVVFCANKTLLPSAQMIDDTLKGSLASLLKQGDIKDKTGEAKWIFTGADSVIRRVLLINAGTFTEALSRKDALKLLNATAAHLTRSAATDATLYFDSLLGPEPQDSDWAVSHFSKVLVKSAYRYTTTKSKNDKPVTLAKVTLATNTKAQAKSAKAALKRGQATGEGVNFARELGNLPPNICTPDYLADLAEAMAKDCPALSTKSLNEKQMEKLGMGAFLSVAKGSEQGGRLIIMEYRGAEKAADKPKDLRNTIVLVGKGITFDTGGISIKPGPQMDEMKFDMCGAASVFGTMKALIAMEAKINIVGLVAAAENMPSGRASKPGDVVTSMSGQTIEILNTDAEGRLVLCDTLTYAERYKPKAVIDIATLTGACVIALGSPASGLYANNQDLANSLLASGEYTFDRAWQMPLWDEYQKALDSNFADMANVGSREAGSVTAACFLSRYTKKYPWAHFDIAGTAWKGGAEKGATGRPVSLLLDYILKTEAPQAGA